MSASDALSRRLVLGSGLGALAGLATGCGSAPAPAASAPKPRRRRYGAGDSQVGDLYLPRSRTPRGTVVVVHGGFWQQGYGLDLGAATSADLAERGWVAWNIEYRRVGIGGGWPATFEDVAAAVDHLARLDGVPLERVVTLGHSAGGHLAAWAASRDASTPGGQPQVPVHATVPLAGVLDLATAAEGQVGGTSVLDLVGGRPERLAARYDLASPAARLPLRVPVRCVHSAVDDVVPLSQSASFVDAARTAGDDAELVEVAGDHYDLIDPATAAWARVVSVLDDLPR